MQDYLKTCGAAVIDKNDDDNGDDDDDMEFSNNTALEELPIIPKLRKVITLVHSSPQRRERFENQCKAYNLPQ